MDVAALPAPSRPLLGDCWVWPGKWRSRGYAMTKIRGRAIGVHKVILEALRGPVPLGLEIDHTCRTKACVNPFHLEMVSHAENVRRGLRPANGRCRNGHIRTPENTLIRPADPSRLRECRICKQSWRLRGRGTTEV